jgi:hypothetical protein
MLQLRRNKFLPTTSHPKSWIADNGSITMEQRPEHYRSVGRVLFHRITTSWLISLVIEQTVGVATRVLQC